MSVAFIDSFQSEWLKRKRSFASSIVIAGSLFTPAIVAVVRLIHFRTLPAKSNAWKQVHALPLSTVVIFLSKLAVILVMLIQFLILFTAAIYVFGIIPSHRVCILEICALVALQLHDRSLRAGQAEGSAPGVAHGRALHAVRDEGRKGMKRSPAPERKHLGLIRLDDLGKREMLRRVQDGAMLKNVFRNGERPPARRDESRAILLLPTARQRRP